MLDQHHKITGPRTLADHIAISLREDIAQRRYEAGVQLPAGRELAQQFGVSITVVREALSRLRADGLIASRQGKGVFVADETTPRSFRLKESSSPHSLRHIFELRMGVEVYAAGLAAQRRTAHDLKTMARCLKAMRPARKGFEEALSADIAFHQSIAMATQNPLIVSFVEFLHPHLREVIKLARMTSSQHTDTQVASFEEHKHVYNAISAGDRDGAARALRRVIEGGLRRLKL